jgi:hypothetical protein
LVIAVEDVCDNRFVQQSRSVIYLPNLQTAHCLHGISCQNLIEFWIAWQVWVDFSQSPSLSLMNFGIGNELRYPFHHLSSAALTVGTKGILTGASMDRLEATMPEGSLK